MSEKTLDQIALEQFVESFAAKKNRVKKTKVRNGEVSNIFVGENIFEETPLEKVSKFLEEKGIGEVELVREKVMERGIRIFFFRSDSEVLQVGYSSNSGITFLRKVSCGHVEDETTYYNR